MNIKEFNNLVDLFFYQAEKQDPQSIFLEWLNTDNRKKFKWSETVLNIYKFAYMSFFDTRVRVLAFDHFLG